MGKHRYKVRVSHPGCYQNKIVERGIRKSLEVEEKGKCLSSGKLPVQLNTEASKAGEDG